MVSETHDGGLWIAIHGRFGDEHVSIVTAALERVLGSHADLSDVGLDLRRARDCSAAALELVARLLDHGARLAQDCTVVAGGTDRLPLDAPIEQAAGLRR